VSESIIRGRFHLGGGGARKREVNDHGLATMAAAAQSPKTGVITMVAVIAEHKILALWNLEFTVAR